MLYEWEAPETADGLQELLQHSADDQATARSVTRGSPEARPDAARSRGAPDRARSGTSTHPQDYVVLPSCDNVIIGR